MVTAIQPKYSTFRDVLALTKPRITLMALLVAVVGMMLAPRGFSWIQAACALLGIGLLVSGSSAFNMYVERDFDKLMSRTRHRPLPAGRMKPALAYVVGWLLSIMAIVALWLGANPLTCLLGIASLFGYVVVYTPMKRMSSFALVVGSIPGAMPVLLGYTAVSGKVDAVGVALFLVAFFWQLPHFIAISMFRSKEYANAGYPVIPNVIGIPWAKFWTVVTTVLLILSSLLLPAFHAVSSFYTATSLLLGVAFIAICLRGIRRENYIIWSRRIFFFSLIYQTVLFVVLAVDVILR